MVEAIQAISSQKILFSTSPLSLLPHHPSHHHSPTTTTTSSNLRIRCNATAGSAAAEGETKKQRKRSVFGIESLTTWLLKQEQSGNIDAELTIVLSSISLACKQIASLLQRSSIINLTGAQGTVNVQGEDQKKLDVISNEVRSLDFFVPYQLPIYMYNVSDCSTVNEQITQFKRKKK